MDRKQKTALQIAGIVLCYLILGIISYFIGSSLAKTFLGAGGVSHTAWVKRYANLVITMASFSGAVSLIWYLSARFGMPVSSHFGVGIRTIWAILGVLNLLFCIGVPNLLYAKLDKNFTIYLLFLVLFGVVGYYGCSLLAAPANYKYTPLGARQLLAPKTK